VQGALVGAAIGGVTGGIRASKQGKGFWSGNVKNPPQPLRLTPAGIKSLNPKIEMSTDIIDAKKYIDSELSFDGDSLEFINNYSDGSSDVLSSFDAVSGPHGNGILPDGNYIVDNLRTRTVSGFSRDGVGFSLDLKPQFQTTRTLLRIHPDGNTLGTLGCIGIRECATRLNQFRNMIQSYFRNISNQIRLNVN